ncbi:MAG: creatininase family protein [Candidatus Lokiarchaeota archaeon]|nr:creatininase family protein [Candidatus Lokiarchaeota archaeon]
MKTLRMEDMNWVDIEKAIKDGFKTVIIGVGSTEQHGPHLPTKTDAIIADVMVDLIVQKLKHALQAQTIRVGCSDHHLPFPGTISLKKSTLKAIIHDYIESLQQHGFENIIFIPTHGGNFNPIKESVEKAQENYPNIKIIAFTDLMKFVDAQDKIAVSLNITVEEAGGHAGEVETSEVLFLAENLVKRERFQPGYLGVLGEEEIEMLFKKGMPSLTEIGVLGDPTKASKEHGKIYIEQIVEFLIDEIKKVL